MIRDDDSWYFIVGFFHGIPSRKSLDWNIYIYSGGGYSIISIYIQDIP
jgi:hypothetical protein